MTLAIRVIPVLLRRDDSLVKGVKFDSWRSVGHPLNGARVHAKRAVDEIIWLDIGATPADKGPDFAMVEKLTKDALVPVTVGGGVRRMKDIEMLFNAGADKVAICTNAVELIPQAASKYGSQAIVAGLDVYGKGVAYKCGAELTTRDPVTCAQKLVKLGAGEILLQRIERDGMMRGYDVDLIRSVSNSVSVPVIASCGCGTYAHMVEAVRAGASAVAAGALFQFTDATPKGAAAYLNDHGLKARLL